MISFILIGFNLIYLIIFIFILYIKKINKKTEKIEFNKFYDKNNYEYNINNNNIEITKNGLNHIQQKKILFKIPNIIFFNLFLKVKNDFLYYKDKKIFSLKNQKLLSRSFKISNQYIIFNNEKIAFISNNKGNKLIPSSEIYEKDSKTFYYLDEIILFINK